MLRNRICVDDLREFRCIARSSLAPVSKTARKMAKTANLARFLFWQICLQGRYVDVLVSINRAWKVTQKPPSTAGTHDYLRFVRINSVSIFSKKVPNHRSSTKFDAGYIFISVASCLYKCIQYYIYMSIFYLFIWHDMKTYKTLFIGGFTQDNVNPPCGGAWFGNSP